MSGKQFSRPEATARTVVTLLALVLLTPHRTSACASCFGQSDSPLAVGMNWGILSLLAFITLVLSGVAGFGVFLARRAANYSAADAAPDGISAPPPSGLKPPLPSVAPSPAGH
jgi:hypothetical protein